MRRPTNNELNGSFIPEHVTRLNVHYYPLGEIVLGQSATQLHTLGQQNSNPDNREIKQQIHYIKPTIRHVKKKNVHPAGIYEPSSPEGTKTITGQKEDR